ncbi:hypothetical protein GT348_01250 [Aristophania vespae]|uniref:DUF883 family protein n=1 Tax=Aristophania vespae TaxID=2697033 RepID=A0A6P1NJR2_9PROT|nr:hypothetical protein [Aristophania vespae]QHI95101.1 hypothetical protein GT348_01250 [Aristophania vespae]UMM64300.1 hypothetical protein DM15PD_13120 [Aristophania vespae]
MAKQVKEKVESASDTVQDQLNNLRNQMQDFMKNHKDLPLDNVKKGLETHLEKASDQLNSLEGPHIEGFCKTVSQRPISAVLLSMFAGFIFGRLSK